jgi:hypothetical protein
MAMVVRFEIMRIMGMIVRLDIMLRMLVLMPIGARAMFVRMRMLVDVGMPMLMDMFVRVRHSTVSMFMAMAVQVRVVVTVTVFVVGAHRSSSSRLGRCHRRLCHNAEPGRRARWLKTTTAGCSAMAR